MKTKIPTLKTRILQKLLLLAFAQLIFALSASAEDCLSYNPENLSIVTIKRNGEVSYTVADGPHYISNFPTFINAERGMRHMRRFNTICFEGRGTSFVRSWYEQR